MVDFMTQHQVFVFDKTNYNSSTPVNNQIVVGKPYMLIKKETKNVIINFGDTVGDPKETSYFYAIDENHEIVEDKVYSVVTDWWHTEASYKNARILGTIESKIVYSPIKYCSDF